MFHVGRCGSTVLGDLLDQHPLVKWDREIYFRRFARNRFELKPFDSRKYLRHQMVVAGSRFYGFEVKFLENQHLAIVGAGLSDYVQQLRDVGVMHYVILERKNYLRMLISWVVGAVGVLVLVSFWLHRGTKWRRASSVPEAPAQVDSLCDKCGHALNLHTDPFDDHAIRRGGMRSCTVEDCTCRLG